MDVRWQPATNVEVAMRFPPLADLLQALTEFAKESIVTKGVPLGEPDEAQRKTAPDGLTPSAGWQVLPAFGVFAYISWDFALLPIWAKLSGSREVIRGPVATHRVTTGPRTSLGKTLALSPQRLQTG